MKTAKREFLFHNPETVTAQDVLDLINQVDRLEDWLDKYRSAYNQVSKELNATVNKYKLAKKALDLFQQDRGSLFGTLARLFNI